MEAEFFHADGQTNRQKDISQWSLFATLQTRLKTEMFSVLVDKFRSTGTRDVHRDTPTDIQSHNMKIASSLYNNDPVIFLVQIAG